MTLKRNNVIDLRGGKRTARPPRGSPAKPRAFFSFGRGRERLRTKRKRARLLVAFAALALAASAAAGLSALSYLPSLSIENVSVEGAGEVRQEIVRAFAESVLYDGSHRFFSRQNMFIYPADAISSGITREFPRIRSADVSRRSPLSRSLVVRVEEREPFALWCGESCYALDRSGFIFAPASTSRSGLTFRGAIEKTGTPRWPLGQSFLPEHFAGTIQLIERLADAGFQPVELIVESAEDFSLRFAEGFVVRQSFIDDAATPVRNLQLALAASPLQNNVKKIDYIDLRFGNRVYYKMKK